MRNELVRPDIAVIGGGLAGICAAVAAARLGRTVALVDNRPVLGGNSSSEVRVWVCGATAHGVHRYAREGGIMGELLVENQYRNPDGNPYLWDALLLDVARGAGHRPVPQHRRAAGGRRRRPDRGRDRLDVGLGTAHPHRGPGVALTWVGTSTTNRVPARRPEPSTRLAWARRADAATSGWFANGRSVRWLT